ncbi:LPXTG cell wall anchor domain-containing protein [Halobacillus sp. Marseille-P3879]|uniref:LPXTG cell wall anchor domain-containing protein n=1 Tax=Halobacillus sp. Marseille-P3879 TaxID=2045014 RepID=UPI000C7CE8A7|nr:LPXTG cell wall anchor domain-containing protein [Halobacillus sp. Marseille-P3879]
MIRMLSVVLFAFLVVFGFQTSVSADDHGEPPVEELEQQFNDLMNLETNDDGEVVNYDSKDRLEEEFKSIMVAPLADDYLDTYFYEENDKLYIEEMDGPYQLQTDQNYDLEKVSDSQYTLTQEGENQLRGEYTLTSDYSYEAGKWVFADRMDRVDDEGGSLPDTATSNPAMMAIGGMVTVLGAGLFLGRRKVE